MPRVLLAALLALVSIAATAWYHHLNVKALKHEHPNFLYANNTIKTPDDNAYLAPPLNYYQRGEWRELHPGASAWFLRTPGYGLYRLLLLECFGLKHAPEAVFVVQLILFGISTAALFYIAIFIGLGNFLSAITALIYGATPFACSLVNYNITESITPQLLILIIALMLWWRLCRKRELLFSTLFLLAFLIITRPVLGFLLLPCGIIFWKDFRNFKVLKTSAALSFTLLPLLVWEIRNTRIAGKFPGLHPIYFETNNNLYRSTHRECWNFEKLFGKDVTSFHEETISMWSGAIGDTSFSLAKKMALGCPQWLSASIGDSALLQAFVLYEKSMVIQQLRYPAERLMPDTIPDYEKTVAENFLLLQQHLVNNHWWRCEVTAPMLNLKRMAAHSNLSLYIFQHTYRGRLWMEVIRMLFACLHISAFLSLLPILFFAEKIGPAARQLRPFALATALYLIYLAWFFRALEERYTLPFLAVGLLCLGALFHSVRNKIKSTSW
ncbi:MAG: hypothetical protein U0T73_03240 [Chitinophagales bacterium]